MGWICLRVIGTRIFLTVLDAWFFGFGALRLWGMGAGVWDGDSNRVTGSSKVRLGFGFRVSALGSVSH